MGEQSRLGDFGRFIFTIYKKGRPVTPFDIEGALVVESDMKNVLLLGTDGVKYLITRKRIKGFIRMPKLITEEMFVEFPSLVIN